MDNNINYSDFLRSNGFKVFPLKKNSKEAGPEWKGEDTLTDYTISGNYGYSPVLNSGTAILDLDDKERFREFATQVATKYLVVETGNGWHIPIRGITGTVSKTELWDSNETATEKDNKVLEIQGPKHYCVGPGSRIYHDKLGKDVEYVNVGTDVICDYEGKAFTDIIESLCAKFGLIGKKRSSRMNSELRDKAHHGEIPGRGQSNDYPYQAGLQFRIDNMNYDDASRVLKDIYDKWTVSPQYSGRPWSNWEDQLKRAYEAESLPVQGRPKKDREEEKDIAVRILENNTNIYSDPETRKLFITENGFLQDITISMEARLTREELTDIGQTNQVMHFLIGLAPNVPEICDERIRFKNGTFDTVDNTFKEDDDTICRIGYPDYNYNASAEPKRFMELILNQIKKESRYNLAAWLCKVPTASKEIRMAILYGKPGTGKTALAETLEFVMGEFGHAVTMTDFFQDRASQAKIIGKTLLYFQDTPKKWADIDRLKQITGETRLTVRGMYEESKVIKNMLSIVMSTNNLAKITSDDEGPMFDRLTLIQFEDRKIRGTAEDEEDFASIVAKKEGEDIISYCLNLRKLDFKFDESEVTKNQWKEISNPEIRMLKDTFHYDKDDPGMSIHNVLEIMHMKYEEVEFDIKSLKKALSELGYTISQGNYIGLVKTVIKDGQETLL